MRRTVDGQGADEALAGYISFLPSYVRGGGRLGQISRAAMLLPDSAPKKRRPRRTRKPAAASTPTEA